MAKDLDFGSSGPSLTTTYDYSILLPPGQYSCILNSRNTLESVLVDDAYAVCNIDGLRPDALRQALSRLRRSVPESPSAEWRMLAGRLSRVSTLTSLETLLAKTDTTIGLTPRISATASLTEKQCIHYVLPGLRAQRLKLLSMKVVSRRFTSRHSKSLPRQVRTSD